MKGAFVYLPLGKSPATDNAPDCHFIDNTDYKRDYEDSRGTEDLPVTRLRAYSHLMKVDAQAEPALNEFLQMLHRINFQITHGAQKAARLPHGVDGLFP